MIRKCYQIDTRTEAKLFENEPWERLGGPLWTKVGFLTFSVFFGAILGSILGVLGLIFGFLLFPTPDFAKSLLIGIIVPAEYFRSFFRQNLLFWSFLVATLGPMISWKIK